MDNLQSTPGKGKVDVEPERRLLGCVLNFPAKLPACEGLRSGDFFAPQHGAVWEGIAALHQEGIALDHPIDVSVLYGKIGAVGKHGTLAASGGDSYLVELMNIEQIGPDLVADLYRGVRLASIDRELRTTRDSVRRRELTAQREHLQIMAEGWPQPAPVSMERARPPTLTPDMLPPSLCPWLRDIAERMQIPLEFPSVMALVSLASLIGRKLAIRPKRLDDWSEVGNLWGLIIGPPSVLKSPAMSAAMEPIERLEDAAREAYAKDHEHAEADEIALRAQRKGIETRISTAARAEDTAEVERLRDELRTLLESTPPMRRYVAQDVTIEALGMLLKDNPNGLLLARDELMGWLRTMERDGHEGDRAFYLHAWTGKGRHSTDRVSRKQTAHKMCLSIIGGIQPGPLSEYVRDAVNHGSGNDGLMQRFQLAVWPELSPDFELLDRRPNREAQDRAYELFRRVDSLEPVEIGATDDEGDGWFLRFAEDAQAEYLPALDRLERRLRFSEGHAAMKAHLGKYRGLVPKLALLFHVVECAGNGTGGPVSLDALRMALRWAEYLEAHAQRIYGQVIEPGHQESIALAQRILSGDLQGEFCAREVYRKGWRGLDSAAAVQAGAEHLIDRHWLRPMPVTNHRGGRPSTRYLINPKLGPDKTAKTDKRTTGAMFSTEAKR